MRFFHIALFFLLICRPVSAGVLDWAGAVTGDPSAQFRVGFLLERKGEKQQAIHWYEKSAEGQNAEAANRLGLLWEEKDGVVAISWHEKAIEWRGDFSRFSLNQRNQSCFHFGNPAGWIPSPGAASALRLGYLYRKGGDEYVSNPEKSHELYRRAYLMGVAPWIIGDIHEMSFKDHKQAVEWYKMEQEKTLLASYKTAQALESAGELDRSAYFYKKAIAEYDEKIRDWEGDSWVKFDGNQDLLLERDPVLADKWMDSVEKWFNWFRLFYEERYQSRRLEPPLFQQGSALKESALTLAWFHYKGRLKTGVDNKKARYFFLRARMFSPDQATALAIARAYQDLYEERRLPEDLKQTLEWYRTAKKAGEMTEAAFDGKMTELNVSIASHGDSGGQCRPSLFLDGGLKPEF